MSIFEKILIEIQQGMIFKTPVKKKPFKIGLINSDKLVFLVGAKTKIPIPKAIWNDIPKFLNGQDWVNIGARYDVTQEMTLQEFIDNHPSRGTQHSSDANYIASVLEYLKVVEVKSSQPSKVKLRA